MEVPALTPAAEDLYRRLEPFAGSDEENGYALAHWCAARAKGFDELDQVVLGTDTRPGWARLFQVDDPVSSPAFALPWVAMFAGIDSLGMSEQEIRDAISLPANLLRGTVASITRAVSATLTGTQTVIVNERTDPGSPGTDKPYHLTIITRTSETPDTAATLAAATSQKPAGLVLHMVTVAGISFDEVPSGHSIDSVSSGVTIDAVTSGDV